MKRQLFFGVLLMWLLLLLLLLLRLAKFELHLCVSLFLACNSRYVFASSSFLPQYFDFKLVWIGIHYSTAKWSREKKDFLLRAFFFFLLVNFHRIFALFFLFCALLMSATNQIKIKSTNTYTFRQTRQHSCPNININGCLV